MPHPRHLALLVLIFAAGCSGFLPLPPGVRQGAGVFTDPAVVAAYWAPASGLTGAALKAALHDIIDNHTVLPYTSTATDVWDALMDLDEDPNNNQNVILLYTRRSQAKSFNASVGINVDAWVRDHTWPSSRGFSNVNWPPFTDLFHLRPADHSVNSSRGDKDFDNGGAVHHEAVLCRTDTDSWEAPDAVKGDIARGLFYMAVRYNGDTAGEPDLELQNSAGSSGQPVIGWLNTLKAWHILDPVDAGERQRNEKIFQFYQKNRNPFIDRPEWVEDIW